MNFIPLEVTGYETGLQTLHSFLIFVIEDELNPWLWNSSVTSIGTKKGLGKIQG